jgi:uncharacterized membrane protein HdeD (DUF308 family)
LLVLAGIFFLVWPEGGQIAGRYLIGGCFVVLGGARVLGYFSNDLYRLAFQCDLGLGSFCVILGVLFILSPDNVQPALPYIIAVYVLIDTLLKLQTALDAKAFGMKHWWGLMLSSLVVTVTSVALLVTHAKLSFPLLLPIVMILSGGESIWNTLGTLRVRTKKEGRFEDLFD